MIMGIGFTIRRKFTTTSSTTPGTVNITETPEKKRRDKTSTAYLVCDVEATCVYAKGFDWPNEIIVSTCTFHASQMLKAQFLNRNGQSFY